MAGGARESGGSRRHVGEGQRAAGVVVETQAVETTICVRGGVVTSLPFVQSPTELSEEGSPENGKENRESGWNKTQSMRIMIYR